MVREQAKIRSRLAEACGGMEPRGDGPELSTGRPTYELADKCRALSCGGIGVVQELVRRLGLAPQINQRLQVMKQPRPYRDSDHVLNIAYNLVCGGEVLDDIELRRNDAVFLDAVGARTIPDPTTAGDYCRRFDDAAIWRLMHVINDVRVDVWKKQGRSFCAETARIDVDGSFVPTTGECKEGMDLCYKGHWGYHPLLVSLANTAEPLFIVNRRGNRPSHEGAPAVLDKAIALVRQAGFRSVLLRGDTDFSMTAELDRWSEDGVHFVFGYDASKSMRNKAEGEGCSEYAELIRKANEALPERAKQPRIKDDIIRERGYYNIRLESEEVAEFEHKPTKAKHAYRMVVVRKNLIEEMGQLHLGNDVRYFFYITNNRKISARDVVREANDRCDQENLIEQLKNGVRALRAPVNTLNANWAYMVMASLAWTIKAWLALSLPIVPRWRWEHEQQRRDVLRMHFRTFVQSMILVPAQLIRSGRQTIFRLLAWRPRLPVLFRVLDAL
jgi:hypothetical protein